MNEGCVLTYMFTNFNISVKIFPSGQYYVTTPGGAAFFNCLSLSGCDDRILDIQWLVNGILLENTNLTNVNTTLVFLSNCGVRVGILSFTNIPLEYNVTSISCRAELNSGRNITARTVVLLLQGEWQRHLWGFLEKILFYHWYQIFCSKVSCYCFVTCVACDLYKHVIQLIMILYLVLYYRGIFYKLKSVCADFDLLNNLVENI